MFLFYFWFPLSGYLRKANVLWVWIWISIWKKKTVSFPEKTSQSLTICMCHWQQRLFSGSLTLFLGFFYYSTFFYPLLLLVFVCYLSWYFHKINCFQTIHSALSFSINLIRFAFGYRLNFSLNLWLKKKGGDGGQGKLSMVPIYIPYISSCYFCL